MTNTPEIMQGGWAAAGYAALYSFYEWLITDGHGHMSGLGILAGIGAVLVVLIKLAEATFRAVIAYKKWKLASDLERAQQGLLPRIRSAVVTRPSDLQE